MHKNEKIKAKKKSPNRSAFAIFHLADRWAQAKPTEKADKRTDKPDDPFTTEQTPKQKRTKSKKIMRHTTGAFAFENGSGNTKKNNHGKRGRYHLYSRSLAATTAETRFITSSGGAATSTASASHSSRGSSSASNCEWTMALFM